jgi:hypothetical protein
VPIVLKSGSLNPWNPQGLSRAAMGLLYHSNIFIFLGSSYEHGSEDNLAEKIETYRLYCQ